MEDKYTISILLTETKDFLSRIIYYLTGRGYTHAAIGLDESEDLYYSFNIKGFRMEHPKRHKEVIKDSICFKLDVTQTEHEKVTELIKEFQEQRFSWKYNLVGVILCMLKIPYKRRWHYFCSQFVVELLQKSKIADLKNNASLYFPNKLGQELRGLMNLNRIVVNPI